MASDGVPVTLPASLVQGSQAPKAVTVKTVGGGSNAPQSGNTTRASAEAVSIATQKAQASNATSQSQTQSAKAKAANATQQKNADNKNELSDQLAQLNKFMNTSGRPFEYRVAPDSRDQTIQEVNPSSGEVVAEFSVDQFPALAKSLGITGVLVDEQA